MTSQRFKWAGVSPGLIPILVALDPRIERYLNDFSRQRHIRKWPSFSWLERGDNHGLLAA